MPGPPFSAGRVLILLRAGKVEIHMIVVVVPRPGRPAVEVHSIPQTAHVGDGKQLVLQVGRQDNPPNPATAAPCRAIQRIEMSGDHGEIDPAGIAPTVVIKGQTVAMPIEGAGGNRPSADERNHEIHGQAVLMRAMRRKWPTCGKPISP